MVNYADSTNFNLLKNSLLQNSNFGSYPAFTGANLTVPSYNNIPFINSTFNYNPSLPYNNSALTSSAKEEKSVEELNREFKKKFTDKVSALCNDAKDSLKSLFSPEEQKIIAEAYKNCIVDPPSNSIVSEAGGQAGFFAVTKSKSIYNFTASGDTRKGLNSVAKEPMQKAWKEAAVTDFIKPSDTFKANKEFNEAVDQLFKVTGKLERARKVEPKLYSQIMSDAQEAIKSGKVEEIKKITDAAKVAKKAKTIEAYEAAVKTAAAEAAEKAAESTGAAAAEVAESASITAGKTAGKTAVKGLLKRCTKFVPVVGNLLFAGFEIFADRDKLKAAKKKGGDAYRNQWIHTGVRAGAVVAGFTAGMQIGAAIGTCIPIPVLGTVVGAIAGGLIGGALSWIGAKVAKWATKEILGPEPGVEAAVDDLVNDENNMCYVDGNFDSEKFNKSGFNAMAAALANSDLKKLDEDTVAILRKYKYLEEAA